MLRLGTVRTGFVLGVTLLLAAIVYFFAANWGGMDRIGRIALSAGLVVLLYGASYGVSRIRAMRGHHLFLSAVLLLGGCIAFGAAVALLGQTYNSHADSYGLFLVWAIPAMLLSFITRYRPFYLLSYLLLHLTLWQYFYPSSITIEYAEGELLMIGGLFALFNLIVLALIEARLLVSAPLRLLSFLVFQASLILMSNSHVYETYGYGMNLISIAAIAGSFYYYTRVRLDKTFLTLGALAASAFAVLKFIELAVEFASAAFFLFGIVFVALLLIANVMFFRYLGNLQAPHGDSGAERQPSDRGPAEDTEAAQSAKAARPAAPKPVGEPIIVAEPYAPPAKVPQPQDRGGRGLAAAIVSTVVTAIGVVVGSASLFGLVTLTAGDTNPSYMMYAIGLLLVIPMIALANIEATVRNTLLTTGFIIGTIAVVWCGSPALTAVFAAVMLIGLIRLPGLFQHYLIYSLLNLNGFALIYQLADGWLDSEPNTEPMLMILLILNAAVAAFSYFYPDRRHTGIASLFYTLLFLFCLTFYGDIVPYSYALLNILHFAAVTLLLFGCIRKHREPEAIICAIFWFAFVGYKYYDLLWSLLHKSITLALLGIAVLAVTYVFARRIGAGASKNDGGTDAARNYWNRIPLLLAAVIVLQLGFVGYQAASSERLLRSGKPIKLQIAPVDPRSLLQGDYVTVDYTISTLPDAAQKELSSKRSIGKVKVVLAPDAAGVYQYSRLYREGEPLEANEVVLNGRWSGWGDVYYGIETYFVPEGTGMAVHENARFAYVRVSRAGNAMLERLAAE